MLNTLRHMSGMGVLARAQQGHSIRDAFDWPGGVMVTLMSIPV